MTAPSILRELVWRYEWVLAGAVSSLYFWLSQNSQTEPDLVGTVVVAASVMSVYLWDSTDLVGAETSKGFPSLTSSSVRRATAGLSSACGVLAVVLLATSNPFIAAMALGGLLILRLFYASLPRRPSPKKSGLKAHFIAAAIVVTFAVLLLRTEKTTLSAVDGTFWACALYLLLYANTTAGDLRDLQEDIRRGVPTLPSFMGSASSALTVSGVCLAFVIGVSLGKPPEGADHLLLALFWHIVCLLALGLTRPAHPKTHNIIDFGLFLPFVSSNILN